MLLIAGQDGYIGSGVRDTCAAGSIPFIGTSRRPQEGSILLDLSADPGGWQIPDNVSCAVLCAAVTGLKYCEEHPAETRTINVERLTALASLLRERGAFVVFISSNQVFAPDEIPAAPSDPPDPANEYGRQKAETEAFFLSLMPDAAIARLPKVVSPTLPRFRQWVDALRQGQVIHPFSDLVFYPIGMRFASDALIEIATRRLGGIHHITCDRGMTYASAATIICDALGFDHRLCVPIQTPASIERPRPLAASDCPYFWGQPQTGGENLIRDIALSM